MFIDLKSKEGKKYIELLQIVGSLSKLFSDNSVPYLYYRIAENIFCETFGADNLSRSDCSADARFMSIGYGLKTFLHKSGQPLEKVAEFNKQRSLYKDFENHPEKLIVTISELRNRRIESTKEIHSLNDMFYHCVTRDRDIFYIHEEPLDCIDFKKIQKVQKRKNTIFFKDSLNEYSFNLSKSTLFKRFFIKPIISFPVKVFDNPLYLLEKLFSENQEIFIKENKNVFDEIIYLPLYSQKGGIHVPEKSQLNQRNASGRARNQDEVYIHIPQFIHKVFVNFFPPKEESFNLILPNKEVLSAKVCQENNKALMSNPNQALGKWLLRDVLKKRYGELVTYNDLQKIGIDTVEIGKKGTDFYINFKNSGTFEEFEQNIIQENV